MVKVNRNEASMPYLRFVAAVILILLLAPFLTACGNKKPTAKITSPTGERVVFVREPIAFQGEGKDPEGKSVSYRWDFADGTTSTSRDPTHSYLKSGKYQVSLAVNDGKLDSDPVTVLIVVKERPVQEEIIRISRMQKAICLVKAGVWVDPMEMDLESLCSDFKPEDIPELCKMTREELQLVCLNYWRSALGLPEQCIMEARQQGGVTSYKASELQVELINALHKYQQTLEKVRKAGANVEPENLAEPRTSITALSQSVAAWEGFCRSFVKDKGEVQWSGGSGSEEPRGEDVERREGVEQLTFSAWGYLSLFRALYPAFSLEKALSDEWFTKQQFMEFVSSDDVASMTTIISDVLTFINASVSMIESGDLTVEALTGMVSNDISVSLQDNPELTESAAEFLTEHGAGEVTVPSDVNEIADGMAEDLVNEMTRGEKSLCKELTAAGIGVECRLFPKVFSSLPTLLNCVHPFYWIRSSEPRLAQLTFSAFGHLSLFKALYPGFSLQQALSEGLFTEQQFADYVSSDEVAAMSGIVCDAVGFITARTRKIKHTERAIEAIQTEVAKQISLALQAKLGLIESSVEFLTEHEVGEVTVPSDVDEIADGMAEDIINEMTQGGASLCQELIAAGVEAECWHFTEVISRPSPWPLLVLVILALVLVGAALI